MKTLFKVMALCALTATPVAAEQAGGLFALGAGLSGAAIAGANAPDAAVVVGGVVANANDDDSR